MKVTPPFSVTHANTGVIFMNAKPKPAGRPVTITTGMPASPSCSSASYVEASIASPVVIVPSTSENRARTGPCSSESGRVMKTRFVSRLRDQAQRGLVNHRHRCAHRSITLTRQPVLEIRVVQTYDAADLEDRQRITRTTCHVAAPTLRPTKCSGDSLPGLDEIRHALP